MGPMEDFGYFDFKTGDEYHPVTVEEKEGDIKAYLENGNEIRPFLIWGLIEQRRNGSVRYWEHDETGVLVFDFYNGSIYEVEAKPEHLMVNVLARQINLRYQPGKKFTITSITFNFESPAEPEEERIKVGDYFIITGRGWVDWIQEIINQIRDNFWWGFTEIGGKLLLTVAIGGGWGIFIVLLLVLTRLSKLIGGKYLTYIVLKALNGKIGRFLNFIPIFNLGGDSFVEERFVNIINLSNIRSTLIELYKQRWYDVLVFPTALASILTIVFVQNHQSITPFFSILNIFVDNKLDALVLSPLLAPLILILVLLYFPMIWAFDEGGFKRLQISPQGDVIAVKPLGKILRDGIGIIIGFSGILSLGALAVEVTNALARSSTSTGQVSIVGFTLDFFGLALLVLWTLGLFLILLGTIVVGTSILAINYLQKDHLSTIEYLRVKSEKQSIITNWGSITHQFSPVAKKAIYEKMEKKIEE